MLTKHFVIMTMQEFKQEAVRRGNYYDNSPKAAEAWSHCWGLGIWWHELWFYKEYRLGRLTLRTGLVRRRHYSYRMVEHLIDGESTSTRTFNKELKQMTDPALTAEEQAYINTQEQLIRERLSPQARAAARRRANSRQASDWPFLPFATA